MPVTARLLQRLHETLGDEATDDLLAWWEDSMVTRAELRGAIEAQGQQLRAAMQAVKAELRAEMAQMEGRLRAEISAMRADMIKWMFIVWAGTVIPLAGLMVALIRL